LTINPFLNTKSFVYVSLKPASACSDACSNLSYHPRAPILPFKGPTNLDPFQAS
jgi:hypothetical protein